MSSLWFILQSSSVLSPTSFVSSLIPSFRLYLYLSLSDLLMTSSPLSLLSSYPPPSSELLVSDLLLVSSALLGWSSNCDSLCQTRVIRLVPWCWCWKLVIKNVIKQTFWLQFVTLKTRCGFLLRQNTGKINFFLLHVSISCSPNQHLSFTLCTTSLFSFAQISSCNSKGVQTRWL